MKKNQLAVTQLDIYVNNPDNFSHVMFTNKKLKFTE